MLDSIKRWIGGSRGKPDGRAVQAWALQRGLSAKRVRQDEGVVVEGPLLGNTWRMEWGVPQRTYLLDRELRMRMDLRLPASMQMLITSRALAEELEQAAYALFTQDMQTQIDSGMPEEMRWLAMFPKVQVAAMKPLRSRFSAVANAPGPLNAWLDPALIAKLDEASRGWLANDEPMVLMTLRGRLYLRFEALEPTAHMLDGALSLYEAAAKSALAATPAVSGQQQAWPTSSSTAWQSHLPSDFPE